MSQMNYDSLMWERNIAWYISHAYLTMETSSTKDKKSAECILEDTALAQKDPSHLKNIPLAASINLEAQCLPEWCHLNPTIMKLPPGELVHFIQEKRALCSLSLPGIPALLGDWRNKGAQMMKQIRNRCDPIPARGDALVIFKLNDIINP